MKELDLSKTIYQLSKEDDEFIEHMVSLGFEEIANKMSLQTVGRIMTLKKGAKMKGISVEDVISYFKKQGYKIKE